ncbi:intracellular ribonuclease LX-like [Impatiens glandulifera]|uniref:intracellular ribonuclease LX-like n=1 Tax=Impatiens glandulifera TaxID=253017 RepID=UPI001FB07014|nr:intracellular ribonuclease LX-like [Impatiens glandulifera]
MKLVRSCSAFIISLVIIVVYEARADHSLSRKPDRGYYDFFYFVQQWPGAYCDSKWGCCFPKTGKPAEDFSIHGLWPNFNDGSYPQNCDHFNRNPFDKSKIIGLTKRMQVEWPTLSCPSGDGFKFWSHEWNKHGTCSANVLNQRSFFQKTLHFKIKSNLLQHLMDAGIYPNDEFYRVEDVEAAIEDGLGVRPYLECNFDKEGNNQLFQVYLCVNKLAKAFIQCPVMPHARRCASSVQFQSFS